MCISLPVQWGGVQAVYEGGGLGGLVLHTIKLAILCGYRLPRYNCGWLWCRGLNKFTLTILLLGIDDNVDRVISPKTFSSQIYRYSSLRNDKFEDCTKFFDDLDPKFVFFGNAKNSIITWKQLRTGHRDGKFNKLIRRKLSKVLATPTQRLVLVIHGFGQNIHADSCSDWPAEMAVKIRNYENRLAAGSTAAVAVCWNSGRVPGSADQETGENNNRFRNIKGF